MTGADAGLQASEGEEARETAGLAGFVSWTARVSAAGCLENR